MARSSLVAPVVQLQNDSGAVLWSIIQGEQLEFAITLGFANDLTGYLFKAVVIEGLNTIDGVAPQAVQPAGIQTTLYSATPVNRGVWAAGTGYNTGEIVNYSGIIYRLTAGVNRILATLPTADSMWVVYLNNVVYIRFPATLATTWARQPTPLANTYGFFELSIIEPVSTPYPKTFKPLRGMVDIMFSPTLAVI